MAHNLFSLIYKEIRFLFFFPFLFPSLNIPSIASFCVTNVLTSSSLCPIYCPQYCLPLTYFYQFPITRLLSSIFIHVHISIVYNFLSALFREMSLSTPHNTLLDTKRLMNLPLNSLFINPQTVLFLRPSLSSFSFYCVYFHYMYYHAICLVLI